MTDCRTFSHERCLDSGASRQESQRTGIIETKTPAVTTCHGRRRLCLPLPPIAGYRDKTLPKRWYNLDVVLTDDFPRG